MTTKKDEMTTMQDWYSACEQFVDLLKTDAKLTQAKFLDSGLSGNKITSSKTHRNKFSKYLKKFRAGTLESSSLSRQRTRKYVGIENKLIAYVDAHARKYQKDKGGMSWMRMQYKCLEWAKDAGLGGEFKCSSSWIDDTLKRRNRLRELEALQCIDTLKQYCIERNAGDSVHAARRLFENELMGMRMQNSNTQRSMDS
jgi:hypothetical protein